METFYFKSEDIFKFYDRIAEAYDLFVPVRVPGRTNSPCACPPGLPAEDYTLTRYADIKKEDVVFSPYRCLEPTARVFFTYVKEAVCTYFSPSSQLSKPGKPTAIAGVKNCDIFSLKIQDYVFLGGNEADPVYRQRREGALIIAGDCPVFKEACFCRAFDINPHPVEGFDFNISPLTNGYLLDVATPRAKAIASSLKEMLKPATLGQLSGRSTKRESVIRRMEEHLAAQKIPKKETLQDIVLSGINSPLWTEQMRTCVECGGCVFACDTCHCFYLADEPETDKGKKIRIWDGCLLKNFSRVAGGANPLRMRYMRLRNRYLKKFDFFVSNLGHQACCGCGRCIEVCPGKIDIRFILRKLYEEKYLRAGTGNG